MARAGQGQTLNDRLNAARYAIAGQGLARVVCKATTEEVIGPKKKHLDYLLQCTHEPNVSIPQLANLLIERTNHSSWVVVFKALITVHHLMCYGNERFTQYLASSNCTFQLNNFLDKTNVKGYDMSTYIKRYSKYINEKALSYRTVAFDFAKIKRGKDAGYLRTMPSEKLLKTLAVLQNQIDALLDFDCPASHLTNGVINGAFMLLFRDLIRLFACYNDGIINLLEKYFDMNKKQCREALDIYKKFLTRMDRVAEFLKTAENVGIDKGEIPDLTKAPSSLLEALEQHLHSMEGNKKGKSSTSKENQPATANQTPSSNSRAATNTASEPVEVKDEVVKKALEEEAKMMNLLKTSSTLQEKHEQDATKKPFNPFLSSPSSEIKQESNNKSSSNDILDLFDAGNTGYTDSKKSTNTAANRASDDLLMLASNSTSLNSAMAAAPNPFADMLYNMQSINSTVPSYNGASSINSNSGGFDANFAAVFGNQNVNSNTSGSSKLPPERPPPPSSGAKSISPESPASSSTSATVASQDDATDKGLKKSIPHEERQHQRQVISKQQPKPNKKIVSTETTLTQHDLPEEHSPDQASRKKASKKVSKKSAADKSGEGLAVVKKDDDTSPSLSPADEIGGAGTTPILPSPTPEQSIGEVKEEDEEGDKEVDKKQKDLVVESAKPTRKKSRPISQKNRDEPKLKNDVPEFDADHKLEAKATEQLPQTSFSEKNLVDPIDDTLSKDLFEFDTTESRPADSSHEKLLSGVEPLVPTPQPTYPTIFVPPTQPIPIDPQHLAFYQAQILAAQQQLAHQQLASGAPLQTQTTTPKSSAFEDLDYQMRTKVAGKTKDVKSVTSPATEVIPTYPVAPGAVFIPGQGVVPVALPPGMMFPQPLLMGAVPQSAAGFDAFGDILQPQKSNLMAGANPVLKSSSPLPSSKTSTTSSLIKGDLDSSLASLAQNLDIKGPKGVGFKKF